MNDFYKYILGVQGYRKYRVSILNCLNTGRHEFLGEALADPLSCYKSAYTNTIQ